MRAQLRSGGRNAPGCILALPQIALDATRTGARLSQPQRPETVRSTKLVCCPKLRRACCGWASRSGPKPCGRRTSLLPETSPCLLRLGQPRSGGSIQDAPNALNASIPHLPLRHLLRSFRLLMFKAGILLRVSSRVLELV